LYRERGIENIGRMQLEHMVIEAGAEETL